MPVSTKCSTTSFGGKISRCHKMLDKIGEITPQSVENLTEGVKQQLRESTPQRMQELAQLNCFASTAVKNFLDKKFGENNYTVIAIGRSISSIAELMKHMGVDAKIIPISGLRRNDTNDLSIKSIETYANFLQSIGLTRQELKNNKDRTYVVMDYAYYGRSLEKMWHFLRRYGIFGKMDNLTKMAIEIPLQEHYTSKGFNTLFSYNRFKNYSYVGRLPVENIEDVFRQSSPDTAPELQGNITKGVRKLYWFNVFDSISRNDYAGIIPTKELNAIYKHYLCPKAVRSYLNREINRINNIT
jgi:hypothetical protein